MDFTPIYQLLNKGQNTQALQELAILERSLPKYSDVDKWELYILKSRILNQETNFDKALNIINELINNLKEEDNPKLYVRVLSEKVHALWKKGNIIAATILIEKVDTIINKIKENSPEIVISGEEQIYYTRATMFLQNGKLQEAEVYYNKALYVSESLENTLLRAKTINNLAGIKKIEEKFEISIGLFEESLEIFEELGIYHHIAMVKNNIGGILLRQVKLDEAESFFKQGLLLREKLTNKKPIAQSLHNLAIIYYRKGNLEKALKFENKSFEIRKSIGDLYGISWSLKKIGDIYQEKGELDDALDHYQKAFMYREKLGVDEEKAQSLHDLGKIYQKIGERELAVSHYKRSLNIFDDIEESIWSSEVLVDLIISLISGKQVQEAKEVLAKFRELVEINPTDALVVQRMKLAEALFYKEIKGFDAASKAKTLFNEIINEDFVEFKITTIAMINLCDLLLLEFKNTEDEKFLFQINEIINQITEFSLDQQSYTLYIENLILKAKLSLIKFEIDDAFDILEEASQTATERNLVSLNKKIEKEKNKLTDKITLWEKLIEENSSYLERINQAEVVDYLKDVSSYIQKI